jgi:hypothetical protein
MVAAHMQLAEGILGNTGGLQERLAERGVLAERLAVDGLLIELIGGRADRGRNLAARLIEPRGGDCDIGELLALPDLGDDAAPGLRLCAFAPCGAAGWPACVPVVAGEAAGAPDCALASDDGVASAGGAAVCGMAALGKVRVAARARPSAQYDAAESDRGSPIFSSPRPPRRREGGAAGKYSEQIFETGIDRIAASICYNVSVVEIIETQ